MERNTPAKYKVLRDELLRAIRAGEFRSGQRLPAERELASRFKVTHMTVRQAVAELVDFELLERRARMGIYVRDNSQEKLSTTTLNLICSVGDSTTTMEFLKHGTEHARNRGWRTRITRSRHGYEGPLVRAVQSGEPSLIFLNLPGLSENLRDAMVHSNGRAVMVGNRMDGEGVPSVLADDKIAIEMAVAHLREAGHEKITLLVNWPDHPIAVVQMAAWRGCFPGLSHEALEKRQITISSGEFRSAPEGGYKAMAEYLKKPDADATAIVANNDMVLFGALFACQEAGLRVPEDMSFICVMESDTMKYLHSGISTVDMCIDKHIEYAMNMVDEALADELAPDDRLRLVQPKLRSRSSVCPPK